ncbi:MAG: GDP-L-fucose synthase [Candidatus Bathyarchaeia archaeon]
MNKTSKIFVCGGTGMVGSAIIKRLIEKGYTNIISNYHTRRPAPEIVPYVNFYPLDLTRQADTETFFATHKPEYVFLSAARVGGILANDTYKAQFIYENIAIASNIIHASYRFGVKKLLNLGSSCIYPRMAPQPMKEEYLLTGPLEPTNEPYAIAKIAAIKLCRYYNEQYGTNFISVMPTNLYGPNDNFNLETSHVLPALIRKFHLAKLLGQGELEAIKEDFRKYPIGFGLDEKVDRLDPASLLKTLAHLGIGFEHEGSDKVVVTLWGTGEVYREFLSVDDLADACVFLMENVQASDMRKLCGDYFINIGAGKDLKIKDLSFLVKDIVGFKGEIEYDPSKPDGTPRKLLDVTKLHSVGWRHRISLEEGIRKTYEWYLSR